MISKKIKIYKSLVFDIEGGLGVKESERTYTSESPIKYAKKNEQTKKKGILKNSRP